MEENCMNCSQPYSTSRWKVDYIMFINTETTDVETTAKIIDVGSALATIFKLSYLPEFNSTSSAAAATIVDDDDGGSTDKTSSPAVCSVCAQVLTNLKKHFDEFNALCEFDSFLSMKTREVDEIIKRHQSSFQQQQQQLSEDDQQGRIHKDSNKNTNQNHDAKLTINPSVNLKRLTTEEMAAAGVTTAIPENNTHSQSSAPIIFDKVQLTDVHLNSIADEAGHTIENSAAGDDDDDDGSNFSDVELVDLMDSTDEDSSSDVEAEPSTERVGVVNVVVSQKSAITTKTTVTPDSKHTSNHPHPSPNGNGQRTIETLNSFTCSKCDTQFKSKFCLQVCSIRNGNTTNSPICDACFASSSTSLNLRHHQITPLQAFRCAICKLTFSDSGALIEHSKTHIVSFLGDSEPTPSDNATLKPNVYYERTRSHECPHCHRKLATVDEVEIHFGNCKVLTKPFVCEACGLKFSHNHLLKKHAVAHSTELQYACENCDQRFLRKGNLVAHEKRRHSTETFQCPQCPKVFRQQQSLNNHLSVHTGIRPHLCSSCGKTFRTKHGIMIHRRIHTGERPSVCKFCPASFSTPSARKNHENIHLEKRPFICDACGKGFSQKENLKRHQRLHTGEKRHKCQDCDLLFVDKRALTKHMLNHNDEAEADLQTKTLQQRRKKGT